ARTPPPPTLFPYTTLFRSPKRNFASSRRCLCRSTGRTRIQLRPCNTRGSPTEPSSHLQDLFHHSQDFPIGDSKRMLASSSAQDRHRSEPKTRPGKGRAAPFRSEPAPFHSPTALRPTKRAPARCEIEWNCWTR